MNEGIRVRLFFWFEVRLVLLALMLSLLANKVRVSGYIYGSTRGMIAVIRKSRAPRTAAGAGGARVSRAKTPKAMASRFVMQFDGGSRGNPGPGGAGAVIYAQRGGANSSKYDEIWCGYWYLGTGVTNNYAEYSALIEGLRQGALLGLTNLTVQGDSELIIRQMQGLYQVRNVKLKPLHNEAKDIMMRFKEPPLLQHIPRSLNGRADYLSNHAMDSKASKAISAAAAVVAANNAVAVAAASAVPAVVAATRKRKSIVAAVDATAVGATEAAASDSTAAVVADFDLHSTCAEGSSMAAAAAVVDASSLPASAAAAIAEKEKEKKEKKKKDKHTPLASPATATTSAPATAAVAAAEIAAAATTTTTTTTTAAAAVESEPVEVEKKKKKATAAAATTTTATTASAAAPKIATTAAKPEVVASLPKKE